MAEMRFFDATGKKCVSVTFHAGHHCGHVQPDAPGGTRFYKALKEYMKSQGAEVPAA
jgi:hypothetical protein